MSLRKSSFGSEQAAPAPEQKQLPTLNQLSVAKVIERLSASVQELARQHSARQLEWTWRAECTGSGIAIGKATASDPLDPQFIAKFFASAQVEQILIFTMIPEAFISNQQSLLGKNDAKQMAGITAAQNANASIRYVPAEAELRPTYKVSHFSMLSGTAAPSTRSADILTSLNPPAGPGKKK